MSNLSRDHLIALRFILTTLMEIRNEVYSLRLGEVHSSRYHRSAIDEADKIMEYHFDFKSEI